MGAHLETAVDDFNGGLTGCIAHQPVRGAQRALVHGAGGGHALAGLAGASQVFEHGLQAGRYNFQGGGGGGRAGGAGRRGG
ncbi:hypothetical protein D3C87_1908510 [compost metagenome]